MDQIESRLEADRLSRAEFMALAEDRADLRARKIGIDISVSAGWLDHLDLRGHAAVAVDRDVDMLGTEAIDDGLPAVSRFRRRRRQARAVGGPDPSFLALALEGSLDE